MYLAGTDSRQEDERQLPPGQHRRRDEQRGGQERKGDEVAVAVGAGDDVLGYMSVERGELGGGFHECCVAGFEGWRLWLHGKGESKVRKAGDSAKRRGCVD